MHVNWDTKIAYVVFYSAPSVRLSNIIQRLERSGDMPYDTLIEYFQAGATAIEAFLGISDFGLKTANELDEILEKYKEKISNELGALDDEICEVNLESAYSKLSQAFDDIRLDELLLNYNLSARTRNFLKQPDYFKMEQEIVGLGNYLRNSKRAQAILKQQPNVGQKSIDEMHELVGKWLKYILPQIFLDDSDIQLVYGIIFLGELHTVSQEHLEQLIVKLDGFDFSVQTVPLKETLGLSEKIDWDNLIELKISANSKILRILEAIFESRDVDILSKRFGLGGAKFTLQEIGDEYKVTKERVRQVEVRSIEKLKTPAYLSLFESILLECADELINILYRDGSQLSDKALSLVKRNLESHHKFLIKVCYGNLKDWLSAKFIVHKRDDNSIVWSLDEDFNNDGTLSHSDSTSIHARLLDCIMQESWPTSLSKLHSYFPGYPPSLILEILADKYDIKFENEYVSTIGKLPMRHRLVVILKSVGRGLHTSEIVAYHTKMFEIATNERAVVAVLMRLDEALIVARGVYDLYENLLFTETQLNEIRETVFKHLKEQKQFISSKKIFADLFLNRLGDYPENLTEYMLHGILQDDPSFLVKRGFMVGLNTDAYDGKFQSLQNEIWQIIDEEGPIKISDIRKKLSQTRRVLDSTIERSIINMNDVYSNRGGEYDRVERIFDSIEDLRKIEDAACINLIRGPLSLFALRQKLSDVDIEINERSLRSIILSNENISYSRKMVSITTLPEYLVDYAAFIKRNDRSNLASPLGTYLCLDAFNTQTNIDEAPEDNSVLKEILSEFDF